MSVLVIAEHDNAEIKPATLNTITAATELGEVVVLVAGSGCRAAAEAAASIAGVTKILLADDAVLEHGAAENLAPLVVKSAGDFGHVLAPATTFGKNLMPRVAALLDVAQISEISAVIDADTFVRPIYAGNALATVKSSDAIKAITVRATAFEPVATEGGSGTIEEISGAEDSGLTAFVSQ